MTLKRLYHLIRTILIPGGGKRADYARKHNIYAHVGENVSIQSRFIPVYSELISFGNNVFVARNVDFVTHDVIHAVLNRLPNVSIKDYRFKEHIGCIEVKDNVMIGSNSIILYDTRIGPNVIVGSGTVVTKDLEPGFVYAGVPAKKIGTFNGFMERRETGEVSGTVSVTTHNQHLTEDEVKNAWKLFFSNH